MNLGELIEKLQELELQHGDQLPVLVDHTYEVAGAAREPTYIVIQLE